MLKNLIKTYIYSIQTYLRRDGASMKESVKVEIRFKNIKNETKNLEMDIEFLNLVLTDQKLMVSDVVYDILDSYLDIERSTYIIICEKQREWNDSL